jgi:hypothetical protein
VREIYISRAGDPVHAGDKALTRETPAQRHFHRCTCNSVRTLGAVYIISTCNLLHFSIDVHAYLLTLPL